MRQFDTGPTQRFTCALKWFTNSPLCQYSTELRLAGIELMVRAQVTPKIYGVARTVADCFKFRNKIGLDVGLEALIQKKMSVDDFWYFAKITRVTNVIQPCLEVLQ